MMSVGQSLIGSVRSIKENIGRMYEAWNPSKSALLSSGLRPVYRITISDKLSSGTITGEGSHVLASTIPTWVKVRDTAVASGFTPKIGLKTVLSAVKSRVEELLQFTDPLYENPVVGILIDESPKNIYRYLVDIIMHNVPYLKADGSRASLAEDLILLGFPIRLTVGFINVDGDFIRHPYEGPISTFGDVAPDFTGMLGALTEELIKSGDMFQGTFVGFEYLLSKFTALDFRIPAKTPLAEVLADIMRRAAVKGILSMKKGKFINADKARIGIPILDAMGVLKHHKTKGQGIRTVKQIAKNAIAYVNIPQHATSGATTPSYSGGFRRVRGIKTFLDIVGILRRDTNTDIYFNEYGRMTIAGKARVAYIAERGAKVYGRVRVHDAAKGANILHFRRTVDLSQVHNKVVMLKQSSTVSASPPQMDFVPLHRVTPQALASPDIELIVKRDEVMRYYGMEPDFGTVPVYYYDDVVPALQWTLGEDEDPIKEMLKDRHRYYGMQGACYMIGNPKIRAGDVLRVSDLRDFGVPGQGIGAKIRFDKTVTQAIDQIKSTFTTMDDYERAEAGERLLRLKSGVGLYHIWKVLHYIGPRGFTSKVFFVKEADALRFPTSDLRQQHLRRTRRGVGAEMGE